MILGPGEVHGLRTSTKAMLTWFAWITNPGSAVLSD